MVSNNDRMNYSRDHIRDQLDLAHSEIQKFHKILKKLTRLLDNLRTSTTEVNDGIPMLCDTIDVYAYRILYLHSRIRRLNTMLK